VKGFRARLDRSPAYAGGILGRSGPNYGEDTQRVLSSVLGMTEEHVPSCARLASCDGCVEIAGAPRCPGVDVRLLVIFGLENDLER
jgi:hypothetical protein